MKIVNFDAIKNKLSILSLILNRTRLQLYRRINTLKMQPLRQSKFILFYLYNIVNIYVIFIRSQCLEYYTSTRIIHKHFNQNKN